MSTRFSCPWVWEGEGCETMTTAADHLSNEFVANDDECWYRILTAGAEQGGGPVYQNLTWNEETMYVRDIASKIEQVKKYMPSLGAPPMTEEDEEERQELLQFLEHCSRHLHLYEFPK